MEPSVVVALIAAAAVVALLVRGQQSAPEPEPAPVRADDEFRSTLRRG